MQHSKRKKEKKKNYLCSMQHKHYSKMTSQITSVTNDVALRKNGRMGYGSLKVYKNRNFKVKWLKFSFFGTRNPRFLYIKFSLISGTGPISTLREPCPLLKMTLYNPNLDLINVNVHTKFG